MEQWRQFIPTVGLKPVIQRDGCGSRIEMAEYWWIRRMKWDDSSYPVGGNYPARIIEIITDENGRHSTEFDETKWRAKPLYLLFSPLVTQPSGPGYKILWRPAQIRVNAELVPSLIRLFWRYRPKLILERVMSTNLWNLLIVPRNLFIQGIVNGCAFLACRHSLSRDISRITRRQAHLILVLRERKFLHVTRVPLRDAIFARWIAFFTPFRISPLQHVSWKKSRKLVII